MCCAMFTGVALSVRAVMTVLSSLTYLDNWYSTLMVNVPAAGNKAAD